MDISTDYIPSDLEFESGLPSPDASDDDEIRTSTDCGIIVSHFCNKLRTQTRPLLSLSQGVPSPTKQLKESGNDKPKEFRTKKRLFKGKQQPSNGAIERRYGYIPNPRWLKSGVPYTKFEPVGVGNNDRDGIPGLVFRDCKKSRHKENQTKLSDHSYQESEFPELNVSGLNRSTKSELSVSGSISLNDNKNLSASAESTEDSRLNDTGKSGFFTDDKHCMSTSTPMKKEKSLMPLNTLNPVGQSLDSSQSVDGSQYRLLTSAKYPESLNSSKCDSANDRSLGSFAVQKTSGTSSNKSCFSTVSNSQQGLSSPTHICENSPTDFRSDLSVLSEKRSWSDLTKKPPSPLVSVGNVAKGVNDIPRLNRDMNYNCSTKASFMGTAWSEVVQTLSPLILSSPEFVERKNSLELTSLKNHICSPQSNKIGNLENKPLQWSDTISQQSPLTINNCLGDGCGDPVVSNSNPENISKTQKTSSPLNISRNSLIAGQTENLTLLKQQMCCETPTGLEKPAFDTRISSLAEISMNHVENSCQKEKCQKGKAGTRNKNRRSKQANDERPSEKCSTPVSNGLSQIKNQSSNSRRNPRNSNIGPRALTLESFLTPQKISGKKTGLPDDRKDILMLHSRFVKGIEVNPISPPKKVRPSPVKRLSFTHTDQQSTEVGFEGALDSEIRHCEKQSTKRVITTGTENSEGKKLNSLFSKANHDLISCLQSYFNQISDAPEKDVFDEEDEDEYPESSSHQKADMFWKEKAEKITLALPVSSKSCDMSCESQEEDECLTPLTRKLEHCTLNSESVKSVVVDGIEQADPAKVTHKLILRKYARRYCYFIEEHQVPNIAVELYFVIQMLTCTEVDRQTLKIIDDQCGGTYFRSVHNSVYFAVSVIKRLRRLFLSLNKTYVELLMACPRIKAFSSKLYRYLMNAVRDNRAGISKQAHIEHCTFIPEEDGTMSFPDSNYAHVFKCQRDNFYAFYRHYHDTSSIYEFKIENQIQYVYDGCTPEQNSVTNLMHLAKLFLDHMILCCVHQRSEGVDVLKMLQCKDQDDKLFNKLYEVFLEVSSTNSGTACPAPGFSDSQMFFKDFIDTLSCPAFNEHLRSLIVLRILELNSTSFSKVTNLHSAATLEESKTPLRTDRFTETVLTLCVLGKLLGYLTFSPYSSGTQPLPPDQFAMLLKMREMIPLPLPLPVLLKKAFDNDHLCLTVPWIVQFLAMMDPMAPQLSLYEALLRKLHFIQRFAWQTLYQEGHRNSGLLIVSCISWLFESPPVPHGFFFSCDTSCENMSRTELSTHHFHIDCQKLVSQQLLSRCCPYLEQGQVLLTLFSLKQKPVSSERSVLPLTFAECPAQRLVSLQSKADFAEIEKWLGSASTLDKDLHHSENKTLTSVIDDEIVPAYVLTRLLVRKDSDDLEDLELHLLQNNLFLKSAVVTVVDLLCAKVADYTHRVILKLLIFDAKVDVRKHFHGLTVENDTGAIRDKILMEANLIANKLSERARHSFYEVCEVTYKKELPALLQFLTSNLDSDVRSSAISIAQKMLARHLHEWANVQVGAALFKRIIVREAEKCARTRPKHLTLYPSDYPKKPEDKHCPALDPGFIELEQLSELIDKALSYGVWYINALTPGTRPDDSHMVQLILEFTSCVEKRMITMDFAFHVMANFLLHLIIQYMVDAPHNWTDEAAEAFIKLCHLCKERNVDNDKVAVTLGDQTKQRKKMKVKVLNLMSVYSVQWLSKSDNQLETLMVYCTLIYQLVESKLLHINTVFKKLTHTKENKNMDPTLKIMINKILLKVLELLHESKDADNTKNYSEDMIARLVKELVAPLLSTDKGEWDVVMSDLALSVESTFGIGVDSYKA